MTTAKKTTINTTLLRKIATQIQNRPNRYNQATFCTRESCGTVHCIAGWCLRLNRPKMSVGEFVKFEAVTHCGRVAGEELGLSDDQATYLFDSDWTPWKEGDSVPTALRKLCTTKGRRECTRMTGVQW